MASSAMAGSRVPSAANPLSTAAITLWASVSKKRRSDSRVSERPKPSVPSGMNRRGYPAGDLVGHHGHVVGDRHHWAAAPAQPLGDHRHPGLILGVQAVPPLHGQRLLPGRFEGGGAQQVDPDLVALGQLGLGVPGGLMGGAREHDGGLLLGAVQRVGSTGTGPTGCARR